MLNQKITNEEKESFRVKVTSAGSTTHPVLGVIPNKGCFPIPVLGTGTISTTNTDAADPGLIVTGVGTLFMTGTAAIKPQVGDYIASDSAGATIRRIMEIRSDTQIKIEAKFVTQLAAASFYIVKKSFYKMIYAKSTGTADAILQEQGFAQGNTFLNGGSPVQYDASTANAAIEFQLDE